MGLNGTAAQFRIEILGHAIVAVDRQELRLEIVTEDAGVAIESS